MAAWHHSGRITGRNVVVTGGSRGIGLGLVKLFLGAGNTVTATTRKADTAGQLHSLMQEHKGRLQVSELDVTRPDSVKAWATAQKGQHIDVLVNNAGIYGRRLPLAELEADDFMQAFQANAIGPFLVVQQLHAAGVIGMQPQEQRGTLVVNVSSLMASQADQTVSRGGGYAYRASKAALNIINKGLSFDLADQGVECVLVHPGYVKTDLTGGQGWIEVEESARGVMGVLESGKPLGGRFYSFSGEEIPW